VILQLIYTVDKVFIFVVVVVIVVEVHAGIHGTGAEILRRQLQPNTHSSLLIIRDVLLILLVLLVVNYGSAEYNRL